MRSSKLLFLLCFLMAKYVMGDQCGGTTYNSDVNLCCNGQLRHKSNTRSICCGTETYNPFIQDCCNDTSSHTLSHYFPCCGDNTTTDSSDYVCCSSDIRGKFTDFNYECCGREAFYPFSELCCDGLVQGKPSDLSQCCGSQAYDMEMFLCCDGAVSEKPAEDFDGTDCCHTQDFNRKTQICCNGTLSTKPTGADVKCCGAAAYDVDTSVCCQGQVRSKVTNSTSCCGDQVIDASKVLCCNDGTTALIPYDDASESEDYFCCEGVVHKKPSGYPFGCCGTKILNALWYECCEGEVKVKSGILFWGGC